MEIHRLHDNDTTARIVEGETRDGVFSPGNCTLHETDAHGVFIVLATIREPEATAFPGIHVFARIDENSVLCFFFRFLYFLLSSPTSRSIWEYASRCKIPRMRREKTNSRKGVTKLYLRPVARHRYIEVAGQFRVPSGITRVDYSCARARKIHCGLAFSKETFVARDIVISSNLDTEHWCPIVTVLLHDERRDYTSSLSNTPRSRRFGNHFALCTRVS